MRFQVVKTIYESALLDDRIVFMTGDLGHTHAEDFKKNLPNQYINAGIAEQNMIGVAAGLALSGKRVFVYSITPFITMRCYEQIKVDVCYQNTNVVVIGVGAGYAYSTCGCTHHAIEDIAIMKSLPNMQIFSPSTPLEARLLTEYLVTASSPAYLRIGKGGEPNPETYCSLSIGKGLVKKNGNDITIFSTGSIIHEAMKTSELLDAVGISTEVVNIHTIKPLDVDLIANRARLRKGVFVLEEHNILGGLGESIARVICELGPKNKPVFKCFGIPDQYNHKAGSIKFMRDCCGLNAENMRQEIIKLLRA